jgi:hypothetical protein
VATRVQQKLALPLLNTSDCSVQYDGFQPDTASQICAGPLQYLATASSASTSTALHCTALHCQE